MEIINATVRINVRVIAALVNGMGYTLVTLGKVLYPIAEASQKIGEILNLTGKKLQAAVNKDKATEQGNKEDNSGIR